MVFGQNCPKHVNKTDMSSKKAPGIKKFESTKSDDGFLWIYVVNNEPNVTYQEEVTYKKFDGLSFVVPRNTKFCEYNYKSGGLLWLSKTHSYKLVLPPNTQ